MRPYQGAAIYLQDWKKNNCIRGLPDKTYRYLCLHDWEITEDGPLVNCLLTFKGAENFPSTLDDNVRRDSSRQPRNAVLQTDVEADGLISVNYYSPTYAYRYVSASEPRGPRFSGISPSLQGVMLLDSRPLAIPQVSYSGNLQYVTVAVCTDFQTHQVGQVFEVLEVISVLIADPDKPPQGIK